MQKLHLFAVLLLLVLLLSNTYSSARKLASKEEVDVKEANKISSKEPVLNKESSDSFEKLTGMDECKNEDEECLNRRAIYEAHLDYIYTQKHKP